MTARFVDLGNGSFIVTDSKATQAPVIRRLAEGRAFLVPSHDLPPDAEVSIPDVTKAIRALKAEVNAQFVARGDMIHMTALALVGGDHAFTQSPPGTGKSRIYRLFAEGLGGNFFTINLAKDVTREMMFGPPSMKAIREDIWDRVWTGLATAHIALIDEVWEANSAVTTILKPILEERRIEEAGISKRAPLLSAFGASNFVPEDRRQSADWDRWLYRLPVNYIGSAAGMRALALADAGSVPVVSRIEPEEILALNAYVDLKGLNPSDELVEDWLHLWEAIRGAGYLVGDRRWKRLLRSAQAEAILRGDDHATGTHLAVARWMFWDNPDQYKEISKLVVGLTDPIATEVLDIEKLAEALRDRVAGLEELDWTQRAGVGTVATQLMNKVKAVEENGSEAYQDRLDPITQLCKDVEASVVNMWRE